MNIDKKTKNDIIKCSRCGLCADICPVFKVKRTENTLLRGKFLQLLGLIRGDLKWSNSLKASIDYCLGCEKCKTQCPAGINPVDIFEKIKYENLTFFKKIFYGKFFLKMKILALKCFYRAKHPVKSMVLGKKDYVVKLDGKLIHFNGCLSKCINPDFQLPFEFSEGDFECCGIPYKAKGNLDVYRDTEVINVQKIENTQGLIVFNCATCLSTVKSYAFNNPESKNRLVFYTELYKKILQTHDFTSKTSDIITFHHPCHLKSAGIELSDIEVLLKNIKNVTYKRLKNPEECCGFGGDFFLAHPRTADSLSLQKIDDVLKSGAKIVLTACPTCLWSLKYALKKRKIRDIKAYDLAEYLSGLDFIAK